MVHPLASSSKVPITLAALLAVIGIGAADWWSGPDFGMSLFYLMPIALVGWRAGMRAALVVAVAASASWLLADLHWRSTADTPISLWNWLTRLVIYVFIAWSMANTRRQRLALEGLNQELQRLLAASDALARTDALTGLANSRAFLERLAAELPRVRRSGAPLCLGYVDLDCFKKVNDRFGHAAGDDVLKQVATALREALREGDVAARMGGDEFALLLWDLSPEAAETVARRIVARVSALAAAYPDTGLGASVGVAYATSAPASTDDLVRIGDDAMYQAKAQGKGTVVVVRV